MNIDVDRILQDIDNDATPSGLVSKSMNISALESEILQLSNLTDPESNRTNSSKLFEERDGDYDDIGESQLMALCSGSFATQNLENVGS